MIIRTNRFIPKRFDAYTIGPVILIRPTRADDAALIAHERVHLQQFYRWLGLNGLLYLFSKKWRLEFELEAHRVEYSLAPNRLDVLAANLAHNYNVGITFTQAREAICR